MTDDAFQRAPFTVPKAVAGHQRLVCPPSYCEQILVARGRKELTAFRDDTTIIQIVNRDPNPIRIRVWRVDLPVRLIAVRLHGFGTLSGRSHSRRNTCTDARRGRSQVSVIALLNVSARVHTTPHSRVNGSYDCILVIITANRATGCLRFVIPSSVSSDFFKL